jgi:hypothetical protein
MTRDHLLNILRTHSTEIARSEFLDRCWLERSVFRRWLAKHELPLSPPRFEPRESETKVMPPQQFVPGGEAKIQTPPQLESREAATAIETSRRTPPSRKPDPRDVVRAYIAKRYPDGVHANVTAKMIARDFESSDGGFKVHERTIRRAMGRR